MKNNPLKLKRICNAIWLFKIDVLYDEIKKKLSNCAILHSYIGRFDKFFTGAKLNHPFQYYGMRIATTETCVNA